MLSTQHMPSVQYNASHYPDLILKKIKILQSDALGKVLFMPSQFTLAYHLCSGKCRERLLIFLIKARCLIKGKTSNEDQ